INEGKTVLGCIIQSWWLDVGSPWDLLEANKIVLTRIHRSINGIIEPGANLIGDIIVEKNAIIRSGAYIIGPVLIDEEADIGPNCYIRPYTYIGKKVRIGNACEIKNSIILNGTHIGHLSYVGDSIIGHDVNFGAGTIIANLRFDNKPVYMNLKGKKVCSNRRKLGAVIGDNVKTGIGVNIIPGIKIGANSVIYPNVTVTIDVPAGKLLKIKKVEYELKDWIIK
ncbi:MAG: bifunctional sugar-1-phosphate nucleotidylyltransferase/acetyltransferase, partial [Candidatus Odinarchaeia archaeon]